MSALEQSLDHYIKISTELNEVPAVWFQEWKGILTEKICIKILELLECNWPTHDEEIETHAQL